MHFKKCTWNMPEQLITQLSPPAYTGLVIVLYSTVYYVDYLVLEALL